MKLYKYLSQARLSVLRDAQIRFSSPISLNDPFEIKPNITALANDTDLVENFEGIATRILIEEYRDIQANLSLDEFLRLASNNIPKAKQEFPALVARLMPQIRETFHRAMLRSIGILCLSETEDSLLMWAHYSNSHQGYVLEFNSESIFFDQRDGENDFRFLHQVQYSKQRPSFVLKNIQGFSPFIQKSEEWSYEGEWRMLMPLAMADNVIGDGPSAIHLYNFPRDTISKVIVGCKATKDTTNEIIDVIQSNDEYKSVEIVRATLDEQEYKLNFLKL